MEWYELHANDFDLVFLGDSRTYCGIHSFLIDPQLGTRSINLAQFAHWLPTQYPMIQDLAPHIPKKTTVVWSIGHQNFFPSSGIQRVYPIGFSRAAKYLYWRVPAKGLADNLLFYNPMTHLFATRGEARKRILDKLDKPMRLGDIDLITVAYAADQAPIGLPSGCDKSDLQCNDLAWKNDARFSDFSVTKDNGVDNSMVFYTSRGSYYRVELVPSFFRDKQLEMTPKIMTDAEAMQWTMAQVDPGLWRLFKEILAELKISGVHVIVNELEEAPFMYPSPLVKEKYRAFMRNEVKRAVEEAGFKYVHVNFDGLSSDDYFDYNHLNSKGSDKFAPMLADAIRPYLKK